MTPAKSGGKWISTHKRLAVYFRDGFQCAYCCGVGHLTLDHVKDCKTHGRDNSPSNIVTCCLSCNSSKKALSKRAWFRVLRSRGVDTRAVSRRIAQLLTKELDLEKGRALELLFKGAGKTQGRKKREAEKTNARTQSARCWKLEPEGEYRR